MKYFTREISKGKGYLDKVEYVEADIGWRWCKDELPEKAGKYLVMDYQGSRGYVFYGTNWQVGGIVQWCKLPEPLSEEPMKDLAERLEKRHGDFVSEPTEPAYDTSWWIIAEMRYEESREDVSEEERYQKFLERIKHDLKIGGGE